MYVKLNLWWQHRFSWQHFFLFAYSFSSQCFSLQFYFQQILDDTNNQINVCFSYIVPCRQRKIAHSWLTLLDDTKSSNSNQIGGYSVQSLHFWSNAVQIGMPGCVAHITLSEVLYFVFLVCMKWKKSMPTNLARSPLEKENCQRVNGTHVCWGRRMCKRKNCRHVIFEYHTSVHLNDSITSFQEEMLRWRCERNISFGKSFQYVSICLSHYAVWIEDWFYFPFSFLPLTDIQRKSYLHDTEVHTSHAVGKYIIIIIE